MPDFDRDGRSPADLERARMADRSATVREQARLRAIGANTGTREHTMGSDSLLGARDVERIVAGAVRAEMQRAAVGQAAVTGAKEAVRLNLGRERHPSLFRAVKALQAGSWTGAELERDLSQTAGELFGFVSDGAHSGRASALHLATTVKEYDQVLDAAKITTPASAAVKALAEGSPSQTAGYQGIETLVGEFAVPLLAPPILAGMPETVKVDVQAKTIEFPRTAAGTVVAAAENTAITPSDITPALGEVVVGRPSHLMLLSMEVYDDIGEPGATVLLQRVMGAEVLSFVDGQYLEGSGVSPNILGIRNMSGLTTSSWTAPANGGTPSGDNLASMVQDIFGANAYPTAMLMNPRTAFAIARLKDGQGRYLFPDFLNAIVALKDDVADYSLPRRLGQLWGVSVWVSSNIPVTETQGTSSSATHIITGDFSRCFVLTRQGVELFASPDIYLGAGQVAVRASFRGAVALSQPKAFSVATGIV